MKRRTPSIGDLLHIAAEAADKPSATAVAAATSSTFSTDISSDCADTRHSKWQYSRHQQRVQVKQHWTCMQVTVTLKTSAGHRACTRARRSYGENAYYQACGEGDAASNVPVFGRSSVIPKPFDERLLPEVAGAVVEAAIATGVARLADIDLVTYKRELADLSIRTSM